MYIDCFHFIVRRVSISRMHWKQAKCMLNIDVCKKGIRLSRIWVIVSSTITYVRLHRCVGIPSLTGSYMHFSVVS